MNCSLIVLVIVSCPNQKNNNRLSAFSINFDVKCCSAVLVCLYYWQWWTAPKQTSVGMVKSGRRQWLSNIFFCFYLADTCSIFAYNSKIVLRPKEKNGKWRQRRSAIVSIRFFFSEKKLSLMYVFVIIQQLFFFIGRKVHATLVNRGPNSGGFFKELFQRPYDH